MNPEDWKQQYLLTPYQEETVEGFRAGEFVYMVGGMDFPNSINRRRFWTIGHDERDMANIVVPDSKGNVTLPVYEPFYRNRLDEVE